MTSPAPTSSAAKRPDIALVMPCYNEEDSVGYTIRRLYAAFRNAGHTLQLVAVDNGSVDRTGEILQALAAEIEGLVPYRIDTNEGYGNGILVGLPLCTAPWIGIIPADGQVDAEDVVRLYQAVVDSNGRVLAKVRRRFRMDGLQRKIVSVTYNLFVWVLWPQLGSLDINGNPKILPSAVVSAMRLKSKGWFLDPEIMIKAHHMGIRVLEFNAFARMRSGGVSHVRLGTCWEFFRNLLYFRFSSDLAKWQTELRASTEWQDRGSATRTSATSQ
jgi:glycosyltransferase involved in cell wall biosynthesis